MATHIVLHVVIQPPDFGCKVNYGSGLIAVKEQLRFLPNSAEFTDKRPRKSQVKSAAAPLVGREADLCCPSRPASEASHLKSASLDPTKTKP